MADEEVEDDRLALIATKWPDVREFLLDLHDARHSERTTAILGTAMIDNLLRRLLLAFLVDDETIAKKLIGGDKSASDRPLANYSARNTACCALGLITREEFRAIEIVGTIRNVFAHQLSYQVSEESLIAKTGQALDLLIADEARKHAGDTRGEQLQTCIVVLCTILAARTSKTKHVLPCEKKVKKHRLKPL